MKRTLTSKKNYLLCFCFLLVSGRSFCIDNPFEIAIKGTKVGFTLTKFATTLPVFVPNIMQGVELINSIAPLVPRAQKLFADMESTRGLPNLLKQSMEAYTKKNYENVGFSAIGVELEKQIPEIMTIILGTYPLLRFSISHIGRPIIDLAHDIGVDINNAFITNFTGDLFIIINSHVLEQTYDMLNELDTVLSYDLLPRVTDLLVEIDRILPQIAKFGIIT